MEGRNLEDCSHKIANQTDEDSELPTSLVTSYEGEDGPYESTQLRLVSTSRTNFR